MWLLSSYQLSCLAFVLLQCVVCNVHAIDECTTMQCPRRRPFIPTLITGDGEYLTIQTSTCPPYRNPGWTNPALACKSNTQYKIPLAPVFANVPIPLGQKDSVYNDVTYLKEDPVPIFGAVGVLINGVNVFGVGSPCGYSSTCPEQDIEAPTKYVDAVESESHTVDMCGGHAAPTGSYHIHSGVGINSTEQREACRLPADNEGEHSQLLGWMFDGFGLYGRYSLGGQVPTDLDECGGHTHMINGEDIYHYHLPDGFPWIIGCYKGCPEVSNNPSELRSIIEANPHYGCSSGYITYREYELSMLSLSLTYVS